MSFGDTGSLGTLPEDLLSCVAFYLSHCPLLILNSTLLILRPTNSFIFLCHLLPDFKFTDRPISRWSFFSNFTLCQTLFSAFFFPLDLRLANRPTDRQEFSVGRSVGRQTDRLIAFFIFWFVGPSVGLLIRHSLEYAKRRTQVDIVWLLLRFRTILRTRMMSEPRKQSFFQNLFLSNERPTIEWTAGKDEAR